MADADPSAPLAWTQMEFAPAKEPETRRGRLEPPPRIGPYVLLRAIGEGGMGVVYAAYDEELERKVAVKLIHPARQGDNELRARILREAQALARVSAANVIHVYQVGEVEGQLYIAMEFVNGTTLTKWQAEPDRTWQEVLRTYLAAGEGLLAAHGAGLVHRDFKPDNVLIDKDGRPRVADFGLARMEHGSDGGTAIPISRPPPMEEVGDTTQVQPGLTQAGVVLGTPLYMAPEQHMGEAADSRSDQFSFCVALYEALYRQLPFTGATYQALAINTVSGRMRPRPAGTHVPLPVHEALLRGLSSSREERFPSMRELLAALAFDPAVDRAAGPESRRRVTVSMFAMSIISVLGIKLLSMLGVGAFGASVITALAFCAIFLFLAFRFRHQMRNLFHRATVLYGFVFSVNILVLRALGGLLGFTSPQLAALDLTALAFSSAMMAGLAMPSLWPIVLLSLGGSFAVTALPAHAHLLSSVIIAISIIAATDRWNRTVRTRSPRPGRDSKRP